MTQADTHLDNFISKAADYLSASQENLQNFVDQIQQYTDALPQSDNDHGDNGNQLSNRAQLQQLKQQAGHLISHSKKLTYLLNLNTPDLPQPNYPLSRIQVLQRQEEERARTAKDLEDSTAQLLANAIFELAAVKHLITSQAELDRTIAGINALQQELEQGLADLRFLIADLEPSSTLGSFGLIAGLRRYLEKFTERTEIEGRIDVQTVIEPLPNTVEIAIFRVIQETLQNIYQHAKATMVQITISESDDRLRFRVIDNGVGLNPNVSNNKQRRLGLVSMKDIADILEGDLQIKSDEQKGTEVTLTIPFPQF